MPAACLGGRPIDMDIDKEVRQAGALERNRSVGGVQSSILHLCRVSGWSAIAPCGEAEAGPNRPWGECKATGYPGWSAGVVVGPAAHRR